MALRKYIVYRHVSPSGKSYVGITRMKYACQRWRKGHGYDSCPLFAKAIKKYGWDNFIHEILEENISEELSDEREKYWIAFYKSNNRQFGYNLEEGGHCKRIVSEETRKKLSAVHKGKPKSIEHRKKLSQANMGKHRSQESENKRVSKRMKPVLQYDFKHNFIAEYNSIKEAAEKNSLDASGISKACRGKIYQLGGYIWEYKRMDGDIYGA